MTAESLEKYRGYLRVLVETQSSPANRALIDLSGIVQQTLFEAHKAVSEGHQIHGDAILSWLRQILAHNLADEIRRLHAKKRARLREVSLQRQLDHSSLQLESLLADSAQQPIDRLLRDEQVLALTAAMLRLPDAQRESLILQHWHGYTLQQIAVALDRTPVAVAGLLKRGLQTLREHFDRPTAGD
ncbi:hypothetical protein AYO47_01640 [Planctomyces sp. SCGC AG-212-M04]|nr:hypothetical protein AYO47_01640 [Planctomyces sp. SCGC AG-212-M04]